MHWRRKWQPTPVFLPGESQGWGAWWAAIYGVAQSRTRLKRLSSSRREGLSKFSAGKTETTTGKICGTSQAVEWLKTLQWLKPHAPNTGIQGAWD